MQCVVVCNHASYLDGIVLTAALPARFGFVIKREMSAVPLAGAVLRRLGSEFVERFNRHRGASDARRVLRNAGQGHSLVFFPEGTFTVTPGLLKFHSGAFVSAAHAGCQGSTGGFVRVHSGVHYPPMVVLPSPGRIEIEVPRRRSRLRRSRTSTRRRGCVMRRRARPSWRRARRA